MKSPILRVVLVLILSVVLVLNSAYGSFSFNEDSAGSASTGTVGRLVKKDERMPIVSTEFGEISAVDIDDGSGSGSGSGIGRDSYHLQFITLEPNSLFLPVLLHADMVFYVQTGSGKLSWTESDDINKVSLRRGDVYRLKSGTLFYIHSSLEAERPRLRIIAIFANPDEQKLQGPSIGPYSSINDLVRGFDKSVLQAAFKVPEEVIEELTSATDTPAIVHAEPKKKNFWQKELLFVDALFGIQEYGLKEAENKKKKKTFNFFKEDPDFKNCNGWSTVVTKHDLHALHGSHISVFMANLTKSSMMGPHWNPLASEVSVVLEGEGMVRVVCPSAPTNKECKNSRFRIEEGDVFTIPRFHPMAQTSFNDKSLVFMGFSTTSKKNHPQFLVGKASVLQTISKSILSSSFNVSKTTIEKLLDAQGKAIILDCTSCAETQERLMEDEIEKEKQEEEKRREEEEQERKRREEEERRRREEEEQKRREEEEERRRREKEEQKRREEEEEERKRREEEEQKRREEEGQRRREEEEQRRREEEERKRHEKEEQRRREEEEQRRREEEEEQRQIEEEEQRRQEEEEQRRQEEEKERRREEEAQQRQEEEERRREEEERREQEEEWQRREEEKREQEEEWQRQEEERREQEEEEERREESREQEEEWQRREEEKVRRQEEEEEWRRQEEEEWRREQQEQQWQEERRREQEEEWERWEEGERGEQEGDWDWDWDWERSENKNWRRFSRYTTKV